MLVDQSSILTEGNGDWKCFVASVFTICDMQYQEFGISATAKTYN